jgi:hypothetical protein
VGIWSQHLTELASFVEFGKTVMRIMLKSWIMSRGSKNEENENACLFIQGVQTAGS